MHIYIIADKVINLIRDANAFISHGKRFHPLHLIICLCLPFSFPCSRRPLVLDVYTTNDRFGAYAAVFVPTSKKIIPHNVVIWNLICIFAAEINK